MTENPTPEPTTESPQSEGSLAEEFRNLGKNLAGTLRAAWESPERKRLHKEIEDGLAELGATLKREANNIAESPKAQQLKADVVDVRDRFRSGEAQAKVREELLAALQAANAELQKVIDLWSSSDDTQADASQSEPPAEVSEEGE